MTALHGAASSNQSESNRGIGIKDSNSVWDLLLSAMTFPRINMDMFDTVVDLYRDEDSATAGHDASPI